MSDLTERLRAVVSEPVVSPHGQRIVGYLDLTAGLIPRDLVMEAADELDRLRAAIATHRKWVEHIHGGLSPIERVNGPGMPWDRELWEALSDE